MKTQAALIALALALTLSACGSDESSSETASAETSAATEAATTQSTEAAETQTAEETTAAPETATPEQLASVIAKNAPDWRETIDASGWCRMLWVTYDKATLTEQVEALTCQLGESTMSLTAETAAGELRALNPPTDMQGIYDKTLSVLDEIAATNFAEACPDLDTILEDTSEACDAARLAMYQALRSLDTQLNAWTPYL